MPQIINNGPGFGGQLGSAFGGGLSAGLQALAQHKFNQISDRHHNKQRVGILKANNISEPIATLIASYPENQQLQALATFGELGLLGRNDALPTQDQLQQERTQEAQTQAITPQEQQAVGLQDVLSSLNPRSKMNPAQRKLVEISGGGNNYLNGLLGQLGQQGVTQGSPLTYPEQQAMQQVQEKPSQEQSVLAPGTVAARPKNISEAFSSKAGKRNFEQEKINTEARKAENEFATGGDIGKEIKGKIGNLRKLVKSGKLSNPTFAAALGLPKKLGVDLSSWLTPETGELSGSENVFYPLIPYVIKGNVTDKKLEAFRDKLPKATDSDDVKARKLDNIEKIVDDMITRSKSSRKVAHQYGENLPSNFRDLVYESAGHKEADQASSESREANNNPEINKLPDPSGYSPDTSFQLSNGDIVKIVNGEWRVA